MSEKENNTLRFVSQILMRKKMNKRAYCNDLRCNMCQISYIFSNFGSLLYEQNSE